MKKNKRFFIVPFSIIIMALCFSYNANAAPARTSMRAAPVARKSVATTTQNTTTTPAPTQPETATTETKAPEFVVVNKSSEFETAVSTIIESAESDNSFAEQIRKQRASIAAKDATSAAATAQKNAINNNSNVCDRDLRKCMAEKCGNDFTKCALDGDTIFGDKLNSCKTQTSCTASEFNLFVPEIRADRDMNVRLSSYENVINCGNQYNACIVNECGTTYNKCLGKTAADAAIQKCSTIAKECSEADSGLSSRFGTAIGKMRENAEKEVKTDEQRMYKLRDLMASACKKLGAAFDERTFDCVYTVNFFAGDNQTTPTASRKRYAGDTFICMQEWFGINATTFKENAFRETRAQTAASSAMLGSGVGTAVGLITSGAINRALDTQKAKKALKKECNAQGGKLKKGECIKKGDKRFDDGTPEDSDEEETPSEEDSVKPESTSVEQSAKQDAQQLREDINAKSSAEVKTDLQKQGLTKARQDAEKSITGDTRTYQQKAADKAVGDHSLTAPKPLSFGQTGTTAKTPASTTPAVKTSTPAVSAVPTKISRPDINSGIGFKATKPTL